MPDSTVMATTKAVAAALLVAAPLAGIALYDHAEPRPEAQKESPVTLAVTPQQLDLLPRPCLPATLTVTFHNGSGEGAYPSAFVRPDAPLRVSREAVTTYVPADYDVAVPVQVLVPRLTPPGEYTVLLEAGRERLSVPVVVSEPPSDPARNLVLGQETTASSTNGLLTPCGVVDGNRTYTTQGYNRPATAWADDTPGVFPDQIETTLAEPARIGRVDLYTHAQRQFALRDWDVQALTGAGWQTVAQVRGHTAGLFSARFEPVTASAVRIVMLATNGYAYSTVVEVEVYEG
ncbi:discoidin domain-containing protein [Micromonospora sp. NPDC048930]|uniref:galactose-binding domain-containing protein n=1 Tax=Micromonospora sp. NPDC048930 TaxID=3364261 RepID=UPI003718768D